ncbi:hypothetical protein JHK84_028018 [Glycine max]|nr:hypothetical protein JHK85_028425 [Glycine max]KAG5151546.1 hypothetical protein JHK84_028018 [Glycine max]
MGENYFCSSPPPPRVRTQLVHLPIQLEPKIGSSPMEVQQRKPTKVLEKETQLLLAQTELNNIKKQLQCAENTKSKTLSELDKAKVTLQELRTKLNSVRESKQSAIEVAKAMNNKAKQLEQALSQKAIGYEAWKQKLEHERKEYTTTVKEESRCFEATTQQNNAIF